ncbi:WD repeat-containing protein 73 [Anabarilius grahami]|uniref:WD repeat-containing protein 73 n=1 Tax=Anabarilius grahami TaxID=495550 RepID=A0A3N0YMZ7_ANAGA|nr:WD repeat-containing protein 73 [Anabarilius grahami]
MLKCRFRIGLVAMEDSAVASVLTKNTLLVTMVVHANTDSIFGYQGRVSTLRLLVFRYKDLHLFQLEHPTKVIEWTGDKSICVAGYTGAKSEILELLLPLKLYAGDNQGLCAERDFKVQHGGFSEEPVECLIHIPGTRCLVTSGSSSSTLQIWDIGGDDSVFVQSDCFDVVDCVCCCVGDGLYCQVRKTEENHYV